MLSQLAQKEDGSQASLDVMSTALLSGPTPIQSKAGTELSSKNHICVCLGHSSITCSATLHGISRGFHATPAMGPTDRKKERFFSTERCVLLC